MKKVKLITMAELYFQYTDNDHKDGIELDDVIRFRQIMNLDYSIYYWKVDIYHKNNSCQAFYNLLTTEYSKRGILQSEDLKDGLTWLHELYPSIKEIKVDRNPITIFAEQDEITAVQKDYEKLINELKQKHPNTVICESFNWNWIR